MPVDLQNLMKAAPDGLARLVPLHKITSHLFFEFMATSTAKVRPSARWTSYDGWDYNGMKERLDAFMSTLNKSALVQHAEHVIGQKFSISEPFSAGQYWACFELVGADGTLVIARVRLPRHPANSSDSVNEQSELYSITCEVATMTFLRENVSTVPFPCLYAYAGPGSQWATSAGAIYMLIEGFYGNTLQDVQWDIYELPESSIVFDDFVNNVRIDIYARAYHQAMDTCPGGVSDFHVPPNWFYRFFLKNVWHCYWRAIRRTS